MLLKTSDIRIRDPFIVPIEAEQMYYMYGTTDENCWDGPGLGFDAYKSADLENWQGPFAAFRPDADFWAEKNFWAPEVYPYQGKYIMFATFIAQGRQRGTQSLISDGPLGPFVPHSDGPLTPQDWSCLDGTLYVDDEGPWMVFCHEWTQIGDGTVCARKLNADLETAVSEPIELFSASTAAWTDELVGFEHQPHLRGYVTDGPYLYATAGGQLLMMWSSYMNQRYALGIARSESGRIAGPWTHDSEPLYKDDGGHGMLFNTFDGQLMLSIHKPNDTPNERPVFLPLRDGDDTLCMMW